MKLRAINLIAVGTLGSAIMGGETAHATLSFGDAFNYAVLANSSVQGLQMNGDSITGNVGIGGPIQVSGPNINGNLNSASSFNQNNIQQGQNNTYTYNFNGTVSGSINKNVGTVTSDLSTISSISSTFASFTSAQSLVINPGSYSGKTQTIQANSGTLETTTYGNAEVFNVNANANASALTFNSGTTLVINGTSSQNVVINITAQNAEINGGITLTGGLTANDVLINILGTGEFQDAAGGAVQNVTIVDENQSIDIETPVDGHVYGGGGSEPFALNTDGPVAASVNDSGLSVQVVPEPGTYLAGLFLLLPLSGAALRMMRKA